MTKRLIVVDVSNFIFRAFFAIRVLNAPDGTPVNAVRGVLSMLLKLMSDYRPTHILLARDTSGGTFRNELYDQYKANRTEPPEDLVPQFALIDELIQKMTFCESKDDTYEADDIIGSAVTQWRDDFDEILIASGDKDLMQFVDGHVKMVDTMKGKIYDEKAVFEKMGVWPYQIVDYLSMVGDTSDNIPGMKGIGAKGAAKLLAEHDTLDKCIDAKDSFKGKKLTNAFENHLDDALLSKRLIQIVTDVDLKLTSEQVQFKFFPSQELMEFLKGLGFKTALSKLEEMRYQDHVVENTDEAQIVNLEAETHSQDRTVKKVNNAEDFKLLMEKLESASAIGMHTEFDSEDIRSKKCTAMAIAFSGEESWVVLFDDGQGQGQGNEKLHLLLEKTWQNERIEICSDHIKKDLAYALSLGLDFKAQTFDIVQAHYNISSSGRHDLASMCDEFLGLDLLHAPDKKSQMSLDLDEDHRIQLLAERAGITYQLSEKFKKSLIELELQDVYYQMDDPLNSTLARMEYEGICLDPDYLKNLEDELTKKLDKIENQIEEIVEERINLNSPKQVGALLFEKLELPVLKKTKTGASTDVEVLEELTAMNMSEVPGLILQYREWGKLQSTYVKALPQLVNSKTKRLHTSFNQHVAQTGRLSSTHPNLQNIPVRSETGKKVRRAFVAKPGHLLLAADYSQVELRLLAHFSQDPTMLKAFQDNQDIHAQTASEIMGVDLKNVTPNERSKAKAVNFGLMYGQSSFGLSKALKISRKEAKEYITTYFERFSKVKAYLDSLKEKCEKNGYAITFHGRKRLLPDIHSSNRTVKAMAERMAINSPIQGTAADILKLAMIEIDGALKQKKMKTKMLLQVHDELIFEVPEEESSELEELVREKMESVVSLKVPLKVDIGVGKNWYELK